MPCNYMRSIHHLFANNKHLEMGRREPVHTRDKTMSSSGINGKRKTQAV